MMTITEILEQARSLTPGERQELAQLLIDMNADNATHKKRQISELRGLGKEIWQGVDAQTYVDQLRDEWNERP